MPVDPKTGLWAPRLGQKQLEVFNCTQRYILSSGPRFSTKTTASLHKILKHAWEVNPARVAMFVKTKVTALSGVWPKLIGSVIEEWFDADLTSKHGARFRYTTKPREMGAIRLHYFKIENMWGGVSEVQMHSLDYDGDVEKKMLSTEFTAIYFGELQNFQDPEVLWITDDQLRMDGVPYESYMWLSDTNPPRNATEHFAYKIWFDGRLSSPPEESTPLEKEEFYEFQRQLALFEFTLDDATGFVDPRQIAKIKAKYRNDPEAWDRFVLGKWTKSRGHGDKHFSSVFRPNVHVIGDINFLDKAEWIVLLPDSTTHSLYGGWDVGKVNHACVFAQKKLTEEGLTRWEVLDELVVLRDKVKVEDFALEAMAKRDALEKMIGHAVEWKDWTDTSAFDVYRGGTDEIDADIVEDVSKGSIHFEAATAAKRPGSVRKRVEKIKELLSENRIYVSAHCEHMIEMLKQLRKGANEVTFIARGQSEKHIFDAFSYMIYMETLEDLEEVIEAKPLQGRRMISFG